LLPEDLPAIEFLADITTAEGDTGATAATETRRKAASAVALAAV
jgi:hypothetical protein